VTSLATPASDNANSFRAVASFTACWILACASAIDGGSGVGSLFDATGGLEDLCKATLRIDDRFMQRYQHFRWVTRFKR